MPRVLVLFAHPALEKSRLHERLVAAVPDHPDLTFHDLYEAYPRLDLEVRREQDLLAAHEIVLLQFPLYWYSTPPMLKQWLDLVLEHGWAYGTSGRALRGKILGCALSAGGPASAYGPGSFNRLTVRQFLAPLEGTAALCGMRYLPPWICYGTHRMQERHLARAGAAYRALLTRFLEHGPPDDLPQDLDDLNHQVDAWLPAEAG